MVWLWGIKHANIGDNKFLKYTRMHLAFIVLQFCQNLTTLIYSFIVL